MLVSRVNREWRVLRAEQKSPDTDGRTVWFLMRRAAVPNRSCAMFHYAKPFSGFSVSSLDQARKFYHDKLGLEVDDTPMGMLQLKIDDDTKVFVYEKPNHEPATFTILNFPVDDIEQAVDELSDKGIRFETYTEGDIRTNEKGIARPGNGAGPKIAWFKDPAGNILSVLEDPTQRAD
jgi:catechol 2,3-dioxygenase-like lactoylglutathione lyase family enzyme